MAPDKIIREIIVSLKVGVMGARVCMGYDLLI